MAITVIFNSVFNATHYSHKYFYGCGRCAVTTANALLHPGIWKPFVITTTNASRTIHLTTRTNKQNFYDTLGVTPRATNAEIKSAYFKLSKKYHPDIKGKDNNASKKFLEISEAYEILSNVTKRTDYDQRFGNPVSSSQNHPNWQRYNERPKYKSKFSSPAEQFNYDMWVRNHYPELFNESQKTKRYSKEQSLPPRYRNEAQKKYLQQRKFLYITVFVIFVMVCSLTEESPNIYDSVKKPKPTI